MSKTIKLTTDDIFKKEFEVEFKGYKVEEVDYFLTQISNDYKNFYDILEDNKKNYKILEQKYNDLLLKQNELESHLEDSNKKIKNFSAKGVEQIDLIKRMNELETKVGK